MATKIKDDLQLCVRHDRGRGRWLPKKYFKSEKYTWCKRCYFGDYRKPDRKLRTQFYNEVIQLERTYIVNEQYRLYARLAKTFNVEMGITRADIWETLTTADWTCAYCMSRRGINLALKQPLMHDGQLVLDNLVCVCNTCKLGLRKKAYAGFSRKDSASA